MMSSKRNLGYWAGVLGTSMFFMGIFGLAYGWTTHAVGVQLEELADVLDHNQVGIAIGGVLHGASVGVLSLSGVETAKTAQKLIELMPSPTFLETLGNIRIGISIVSIVIGIFLAMQFRWSVIAGAIWSVLSIGWFVYVTYMAWELLTDSLGHPMDGGNTMFFIVDVALHLAWPVVLATFLIPAHVKGRRRRLRASVMSSQC